MSFKDMIEEDLFCQFVDKLSSRYSLEDLYVIHKHLLEVFGPAFEEADLEPALDFFRHGLEHEPGRLIGLCAFMLVGLRFSIDFSQMKEQEERTEVLREGGLLQ